MKHTVISAALLLAVALTGCGGGGGGGSTVATSTTSAVSVLQALGTVSTTNIYIPSLTAGDFSGNGSHYVLVSGHLTSGSSKPPVKIYKLNDDGTTADSTVAILGSEFSWAVNYPQIADFNHDGIDDIFFPGFTDGVGSVTDNPSVAFISRVGQSHRRVDVDGLSWSHGSSLLDANKDGWLDVINNNGDMWINDQAGGFTFRPKDTFKTINYPFAGAGICSGDLDGSGATQVVLTDQSGFHASQFIYKLNANMEPIYQGTLPVPFFDKNNTDLNSNRSHDVTCKITDVNGDGRQDVIVVSYLFDNAVTRVSGAQSIVQVYYNLGNYVFSDATDISMSGYNQGVLASYTPKIIDFNNDNSSDIWLMNTSNAETGNQVWLNDGAGKFKQSRKQDFNNLAALQAKFSDIDAGTTSIMLPVKVNGKWNFVLAGVSSTNNTVSIAYANTQWTF